MTEIVYYAYQADTYCPSCIIAMLSTPEQGWIESGDAEGMLDALASTRRGFSRADADTADFPVPSFGEDGLYYEDGFPRVCGTCHAAFDESYEPPEGDLSRWIEALGTVEDAAEWDPAHVDHADGPAMVLARVDEPRTGYDKCLIEAALYALADGRRTVRLSPEEIQGAVDGAVVFEDGWSQLGQEYLDDHFPGFPSTWVYDLEQVGRDVRREHERYVQLSGSHALYVFSA